MFEMIDRMFDDTLWIWTAIGGSIVGAVSLAYLKELVREFGFILVWIRRLTF